MIRYIYYFLKSDTEQIYNIVGDNIRITVFKGDLKNIFPMCGKRAHDVYVDKDFNTKQYQDIINECIKPLASFSGGEGLVFI